MCVCVCVCLCVCVRVCAEGDGVWSILCNLLHALESQEWRAIHAPACTLPTYLYVSVETVCVCVCVRVYVHVCEVQVFVHKVVTVIEFQT